MSSYSDMRLTESLDGCAVRVVDRDRVADVRASMPGGEGHCPEAHGPAHHHRDSRR